MKYNYLKPEAVILTFDTENVVTDSGVEAYQKLLEGSTGVTKTNITTVDTVLQFE